MDTVWSEGMSRLLVSTLAMLAACGAGPATPNGRVDLTVSGVSRDAAKELLLRGALSHRWHVVSHDDAGLEITRLRSVDGEVEKEPNTSAITYDHIRFSIVDDGNGVRVHAKASRHVKHDAEPEVVTVLSSPELDAEMQRALLDCFFETATRDTKPGK